MATDRYFLISLILLHFYLILVASRKASHENLSDYDRSIASEERSYERRRVHIAPRVPTHRRLEEFQEYDEEIVPVVPRNQEVSRLRHRRPSPRPRHQRRRFPESYEEFPETTDYDNTPKNSRLSNHEADINPLVENPPDITKYTRKQTRNYDTTHDVGINVQPESTIAITTTLAPTTTVPTTTTTALETPVVSALHAADGSDRKKLIDEFFYFLERYSSLNGNKGALLNATAPIPITSISTTTLPPSTTTSSTTLSTRGFSPTIRSLSLATTTKDRHSKKINEFFDEYYSDDHVDETSRSPRTTTLRPEFERAFDTGFGSGSFGGGAGPFGGGSGSFDSGNLPPGLGEIPLDTGDVAQVFKLLQESNFKIAHNGKVQHENEGAKTTTRSPPPPPPPKFLPDLHSEARIGPTLIPPTNIHSKKKKPKRIMTSSLHTLENQGGVSFPPNAGLIDSSRPSNPAQKKTKKRNRKVINSTVLDVSSTLLPKTTTRAPKKHTISNETQLRPRPERPQTPKSSKLAEALPASLKVPACVIKPMRSCKKRCTPTTSTGEICLPPIDQMPECLYSTYCCCPL